MGKKRRIKKLPCDECTISGFCAQKEEFINRVYKTYGILNGIPANSSMICQQQQRRKDNNDPIEKGVLKEDTIKALKQLSNDIQSENDKKNKLTTGNTGVIIKEKGNTKLDDVSKNNKNTKKIAKPKIKLTGAHKTLHPQRKVLVTDIIRCAIDAINEFQPTDIDFKTYDCIKFKAQKRKFVFAEVYPQGTECQISFRIDDSDDKIVKRILEIVKEYKLKSPKTKNLQRAISKKFTGSWYTFNVNKDNIIRARKAFMVLFRISYEQTNYVSATSIKSQHIIAEENHRKALQAAAKAKRERTKHQHLVGNWINHKQFGEGVIVDYKYTDGQGYIFVQFITEPEAMQFSYPNSIDNNAIHILSDISEDKTTLAREILAKSKQENAVTKKKKKVAPKPVLSIDDTVSSDGMESVIQVISKKFKNGYRISSHIDFEIFQECYFETFKELPLIKERTLNSFLTENAVIRDGRAFF